MTVLLKRPKRILTGDKKRFFWFYIYVCISLAIKFNICVNRVLRMLWRFDKFKQQSFILYKVKHTNVNIYELMHKCYFYCLQTIYHPVTYITVDSVYVVLTLLSVVLNCKHWSKFNRATLNVNIFQNAFHTRLLT